jgi:DNA-binding transcriptional ArsR family regulator
MTAPFESLAGLSRLIHEPARLAILTALSAGESVDFLFLQRLTGLSKGNLSSHLAKLGEAGLVDITKEVVGNTPQTRLSLTHRGRSEIDDYWKQLEALHKAVKKWRR